MIRRSAILGALSALAVCFHTGCVKRDDNPVAAIQEAVFRYQFDHNASVQQKRATVFFLAFGDPRESNAEDPPGDFLARFNGHEPRIARYSDAGTSDTGWVIDRKTGKSGVIFFVHSVRLLDRDTATAKGGYHEDKRSASGNTYRLEFGWRGWKVVDAGMDWISRDSPHPRESATLVASAGLTIGDRAQQAATLRWR